MSDRIQNIKETIEKTIGGKATHVTSTPIREMFRGELAWEGIVETFDITLNPSVKRCYGLMYRDSEITSYAAIRETDDINSPEMAAKVFVASQIRDSDELPD